MASAADQMAANINLANFSKATDLKKRLWFTLGALVVFRLLSFVPLPGIDPRALNALFNTTRGGVLDFFNMFSGGSLERMSLIALGVMPYITASIVVQLATSMSPTLAALKKEGESGRKKINQYTRYGTVFLCAIQGYFIAVGLEGWGAGSSGSAVIDPGLVFRITTVVSLVGGTMVLMWLGEQITSRGIGNGISLIIMAGIVFFTFFYTSVVFNPEETAEKLKKYVGFIPGIRPGKRTEEYLDYVLTRVTVVGAAYLTLTCLIPEWLIARAGIPFYLGGTSLIIVVNVTMDTVTQIQSHLLAHQYGDLIKKAKLKGGGLRR